MRAIRVCCIIGCSSNSKENPNLQFFKFPNPKLKLHGLWMQACTASLSRILNIKKSFVCTLHFSPCSIGNNGRRKYKTIPTLLLDGPSKLNEVEQIDMADKMERRRKCEFIDAVVYEWMVRVNFNLNSRFKITFGMLKDKAHAAKAVIMLDDFEPDNRWLNRFWATHLRGFFAKLEKQQLKPLGTSLWIPDIVNDLQHRFPPTSTLISPYVRPYGDYEDDDARDQQQNPNGNTSYRNNKNNIFNNSHNWTVPLNKTTMSCESTNGKRSPFSSLSPLLMHFSPIKKPKLSVASTSSPSSSSSPSTQPTCAHDQNSDVTPDHMSLKSVNYGMTVNGYDGAIEDPLLIQTYEDGVSQATGGFCDHEGE